MIKFFNYTISKQYAEIILRADYLYEPSFDEKDSFTLGTPKCWDDTFLERFRLDGYIIYHIFSYTLAKEKVNRITDHKNVWGLCNIPKGTYSNYIDNTKSRTYVGIDVSYDDIGFRSKASSTVIICSNNSKIPYDDLFSLFCNSRINFFEDPRYMQLKTISNYLPDCVLLHYSICESAQLVVLGNDVESLFCEKDCSTWETCSNISLYHHA